MAVITASSGLQGLSIGLAVDATGVASGITVATRSLNQFGQQASRTGSVVQSQFGNRMQQASFQLADFAVQLQSGQGFMRAFVQQGSQIAASFGPIGAAAGAAVAVLGGLATALFTSQEASEAADAAHKALSETLIKENDTVETLASRLGELSGVQRELAGLQLAREARLASEALEQQKTAAAGLVQEVARLQAGYAATIESFGLTFIDPGPLNETQRALQKTLETIQRTGVVTSELAQQLDKLATTTGSAELREVADRALGVALAADEAQRKLDAASGAMAELGRSAYITKDQLRAAAEGLADVELAASGLTPEQAGQGLQELERSIKEQAQLRKQAAAEAAREAEQAAQREKRRQQERITELENIATRTVRAGNAARYQAKQAAAREEKRLQEQAAIEQQRAMLVPYEEPKPQAQRATVEAFRLALAA